MKVIEVFFFFRLLSQVLATFCTQTLHYYWMAAFFDSDDDTPEEKQRWKKKSL